MMPNSRFLKSILCIFWIAIFDFIHIFAFFFSHFQLTGNYLKGLTITCAIGAGALGLSAATLPFVLPAFRRVCIPYVPATVKQIENVVKLMDQYKNANPATRGLKIIDLGSGDGRVILNWLRRD
uniref:Uncharacterized protein n=1 Tax=Meloidogyne incognita TaxID=6306 RepID=A0A914LJQ4_MELIC